MYGRKQELSKEAAAAKKKELITAMRSLPQMPQRFPFFEEMYITPNKYHKMFVEKCILDCRKDYGWLIH